MKKKNLTNIPTRKSICNSGMVANVASFSRSFLYPLGCRTRIVLVFHSSGGILPLQSSYCVCCALVLFLRQQYSSTPDNERIFGDERTWQQQQQQQQDWSAPRADGTLRKKKTPTDEKSQGTDRGGPASFLSSSSGMRRSIPYLSLTRKTTLRTTCWRTRRKTTPFRTKIVKWIS